jgi:hypothetical protein
MYLKETLFWIRGLEQFGKIIIFYNQIKGFLMVFARDNLGIEYAKI